MRKRWQSVAYLLLYLLLLSLITEFEIKKLFDLQSFLALMAGSVLLTLPFCRRDMAKEELLSVFANKAIDAGLIQVFLLVFIRLSDAREYSGLLPDLAMCFRPMLYAFCIRVILERESAADVRADGNRDESDGAGQRAEATAATADALTAADCLTAGLTNRETEIAMLICRRYSNREIAQELVISETTVKKHVSNIFEKTGIRRRVELEAALREQGKR